ncbi:hypothetical protein TIFTF001_051991 [Ficus carica]|uniref:Uncharacterized protein n=1 Tax=Ficus carica TaxID=3494 RepID=A0AA88JHL6_FICCA|nr:hypothetical protein TIFTF001_051991 [Ficus carica]
MASSTTHAASSILRRVHQGTHAAFPLSFATLRPYRRSTSRKVVMYIAWSIKEQEEKNHKKSKKNAAANNGGFLNQEQPNDKHLFLRIVKILPGFLSA